MGENGDSEEDSSSKPSIPERAYSLAPRAKVLVARHRHVPIKSKLQHPPSGKPRAFDYFPCLGSGEFDLHLGGVEKIEPEVSGFK